MGYSGERDMSITREIVVLRNLLRQRIFSSPKTESGIIEAFHKLYYSKEMTGGTWYDTTWRGIPTLKCPLDLWVYQEIIHEKLPDIIIETGTFKGGSALYMADVCEAIGHGVVYSIDIQAMARPNHKRITYIHGSSTEVSFPIPTNAKVMVILDSDHSKTHVLNELERYSDVVTKGQYMIVEDTNINKHPVLDDFGPGPMEAVEEFMKDSPDFEIDGTREKFLLTFNPKGFLIKK